MSPNQTRTKDAGTNQELVDLLRMAASAIS